VRSSILQLTVTRPGSASEAVPNGLLLRLQFRVADSAAPGEIRLGHTAVVRTRDAGNPPEGNVAVFDGRIKVEQKEVLLPKV